MSLQTFFYNFPLLLDSPDGVRKLRQLILDLGVRGSLATQDPSDESATILLEKILGKSKALSLPAENAPFPLPANWLWIRFGDVYDIQGGTQPPKSQFVSSPTDGYVRLLQIRDFGQKPEPVYIKRDSVKSFCTITDVMLARYGASVGKVFMGQDGAYNVALTKLIFNHDYLYNRFVYYLLKSSLFQDYLKPMSRSAQAGFNKGNIHPIPLPLPPLEEQKRIVAKVDELMRLCDELEARQQARRESRVRLNSATLAPLNNAASLAPEEFEQATVRLADNFSTLYDSAETVGKLRSAILQLAVRGKLTQQWRANENISQEESWKTVEFFEFCVLQRGYDLPLAERDEGRFPIVTSAGVAAYHSEYKSKAPGVVVGRSGSIGKVFYVEENFWPHNTALYVKDFKGNYPMYVYFYLLGFKAEQFSKSTAVPTLNRNNLRGVMVDVPSYEEQKRIVDKVNQLMALCDELETKLRQAEADSEKLMNAAVQHVLDAVSGKEKSQRESALALASP